MLLPALHFACALSMWQDYLAVSVDGQFWICFYTPILSGNLNSIIGNISFLVSQQKATIIFYLLYYFYFWALPFTPQHKLPYYDTGTQTIERSINFWEWRSWNSWFSSLTFWIHVCSKILTGHICNNRSPLLLVGLSSHKIVFWIRLCTVACILMYSNNYIVVHFV